MYYVNKVLIVPSFVGLYVENPPYLFAPKRSKISEKMSSLAEVPAMMKSTAQEIEFATDVLHRNRVT